jgi:hypothetical protein
LYHHVKKLMYAVRVGAPDPRFGNMLLQTMGNGGRLATRTCDARSWIVSGPRARMPWPIAPTDEFVGNLRVFQFPRIVVV